MNVQCSLIWEFLLYDFKLGHYMSLWLNVGEQIAHGGQVQRPRQLRLYKNLFVLERCGLLMFGKTIKRTLFVCLRHSRTQQGHSEFWIFRKIMLVVSFKYLWFNDVISFSIDLYWKKIVEITVGICVHTGQCRYIRAFWFPKEGEGSPMPFKKAIIGGIAGS